MSDKLIIMQKVKCGVEPNQKLIKISEMLKKPLKSLKENKSKKKYYNSANSFFSMFMLPIDQQYIQPVPEEHAESANFLEKIESLNCKADSFEDYPARTKKYQSSINLIKPESLTAKIEGVPYMVKKCITSINDFLKTPFITTSGYTVAERRMYSQTNLISKIKSNNQRKIKFTKLLQMGWEHRIAFDKNKSLQKFELHNHVQTIIKREKLKRNIQSNTFNYPQNIDRPDMYYTNNSEISYNTKKTSILNNYNTNEYSINNLSQSNRNHKHAINNNFNFTCNHIHYFPLNKVCDFTHTLKERKIINKIKNGRPSSVK